MHINKLQALQFKFRNPKRRFIKPFDSRTKQDVLTNTITKNVSFNFGPSMVQAKRFRLFQSVGFQGDHENALTLICMVLEKLDFEW